MMIFVTTTDAFADEKLYEKAYSLVPEYRRAKADRMKMRENKLQTVTAGLLLNYAVGIWNTKMREKNYKTKYVRFRRVDADSIIKANNQCFDYDIAYNSQGKPYFLSHCEIFFNISHSSNYVACAISDRPVGIDIEGGRKARQNLAKRFFDESEASWINECQSEERFFRIWTLKEAYGKATGKGVLDILDKIVYRLKEGKMTAYIDDVPQNFTIVERKVDDLYLSAIQL